MGSVSVEIGPSFRWDDEKILEDHRHTGFDMTVVLSDQKNPRDRPGDKVVQYVI